VGHLIGGEELHNNHHTYPNSAKLSVKRWEFDHGLGLDQVFSFLRLAKVQRVAPIAHRVEGKATWTWTPPWRSSTTASRSWPSTASW
jgi:fatty-acid desaturase